MNGNLARLSEEGLSALLALPEQVGVLFQAAAALDTDRRERAGLARLLGRRRPRMKPSAPALEPLPGGDVIDIGKSWQVLHFLFTGSEWEGEFPEGFLVSGGTPVGTGDAGGGSARSFTPEETARIARFLGGLTREGLRGRLNLKHGEQFEIYPRFWKDEDRVQEEWKTACDGLDRMTPFVEQAAERGMALLLVIN